MVFLNVRSNVGMLHMLSFLTTIGFALRSLDSGLKRRPAVSSVPALMRMIMQSCESYSSSLLQSKTERVDYFHCHTRYFSPTLETHAWH